MSKTKTIFDELKAALVLKVINTPFAQKLISEKYAKKIYKSQEDQPTKPIEQLHKATGQLVFIDTNKPLHNIELEVWDRDIGTPSDYLGRGVTDRNGRFEIYYDPDKAGFKDAPDLELRIIDNRVKFDADNQPIYTNRLAYIIKGDDNVTQKSYDFGTLSIPYWTYDPESPFARILMPNPEETPDNYAIGRIFQAYEAANTLTPIKAKHVIANNLNPKEPSLAKIQGDYPPNLTINLDRENPHYTRSDEYFVLRILNGMNPCLLKRNKSNPNQFKVTFNWDTYEKDTEHDLSNVEAFFELKDGKIVPTAITIQNRYPDSFAPHSPLEDPVTSTPNDPEKWLQAKRIFRSYSFFMGETVEHYSKAHVQMEQYAVAFFRNLRKNPIRLMLAPHLKSIININRRGDVLLVHPTSGLFVTNGPLTYPGFLQICKEVVANYDWKGWKPRQPVCEDHTYAKAANLYWQILTEYIDGFFEKHKEGIAEEWVEIRRFSEDLVEHSLAYQPVQGIMANTDSDYEWYDVSELDKPDIPRTTIDGTVKVIRPITVSDSPNPADIDNLKQCCRYIIFHLTFWHTWVNDSQSDEGGEVVYSSMGLRNGSFGAENDPAIAPDPIECTNQLYSVLVLNGIKYGLIVKNEDDDVPEELRTALINHKDQFADLGIDIGNIRTLINI
ncbi:lipoxygenase family protein [Crocosphaera sp. UHCC 0190]|uniref:lipoxygenase family protein n=1 Tax=Crocosphaera sp. UHCC 0190 TaxID=3110246 RepID=UPI002B214892|nr:lipoxygenase family protein [Crocosphaera sp. UHCC 0190]MEA5510770.1 lipoxygenase family protein [Crocosphaera sp. UHCC 0190]